MLATDNRLDLLLPSSRARSPDKSHNIFQPEKQAERPFQNFPAIPRVQVTVEMSLGAQRLQQSPAQVSTIN